MIATRVIAADQPELTDVRPAEALPVGEIVVIGGNAPGETSWLVVIKRTE